MKSPKIYLRDSGIFHALQGIPSARDLFTHPKLGASWEGFALETDSAREFHSLAGGIATAPRRTCLIHTEPPFDSATSPAVEWNSPAESLKEVV